LISFPLRNLLQTKTEYPLMSCVYISILSTILYPCPFVLLADITAFDDTPSSLSSFPTMAYGRAFAVSAQEASAWTWSSAIRSTRSCCDVGCSWTYVSCLAGCLMQGLNKPIRMNRDWRGVTDVIFL
jgi:hypothetical protein